MPLKIYYNGSATLYGARWGNPLALEFYRNQDKAHHRCTISYGPGNGEIDYWLPNNKIKEDRKFSLGYGQRQKIISSAKFGYDTKKNNILFLTATFQEGEFENIENPLSHPNTVLVKWLDNLRHNYQAGGYVWTKELTKKKTPHYHILIEMPFQKIKKLNDSFCESRGYHSNNAVRHDKKNGLVVKSWQRSAGYAAKYISKCRDVVYHKRCYSVANKWQVPGLVFHDVSEIKEILRHFQPVSKEKNLIKTDFTEVFRINPEFTKELFQTMI